MNEEPQTQNAPEFIHIVLMAETQVDSKTTLLVTTSFFRVLTLSAHILTLWETNKVQRHYINCLQFQHFSLLQETLYWRSRASQLSELWDILLFKMFLSVFFSGCQPFALYAAAMPTFFPSFHKQGDQMVSPCVCVHL